MHMKDVKKMATEESGRLQKVVISKSYEMVLNLRVLQRAFCSIWAQEQRAVPAGIYVELKNKKT